VQVATKGSDQCHLSIAKGSRIDESPVTGPFTARVAAGPAALLLDAPSEVVDA
jgi:hypothetical protein